MLWFDNELMIKGPPGCDFATAIGAAVVTGQPSLGDHSAAGLTWFVIFSFETLLPKTIVDRQCSHFDYQFVRHYRLLLTNESSLVAMELILTLMLTRPARMFCKRVTGWFYGDDGISRHSPIGDAIVSTTCGHS